MHYLKKSYPPDHPDLALMFDQVSVWSAYFGRLLLDHIPIRRNMKILDVACGAGFPTLEIAMMYGASCSITGIDPWEAGLERARWKAKKYDLDHVNFILGDAASMSFEDNEFDLIVSNVGINNFEEPALVLKECYRILKRMGRMCITTNVSGHFSEFYTVFETVLKELGKSDLIPALQQQEAHRGTDETVRELFEEAGFSVAKVIKDRFKMRFADGSALLNHLLITEGFLPGWRSLLSPEEEAPVFSLIEQKLNEQASWDGELKLSVPMIYLEALK